MLTYVRKRDTLIISVCLQRCYAFKWTAAVGLSLSSDSIKSVLPYILSPLEREITTQTQQSKDIYICFVRL